MVRGGQARSSRSVCVVVVVVLVVVLSAVLILALTRILHRTSAGGGQGCCEAIGWGLGEDSVGTGEGDGCCCSEMVTVMARWASGGVLAAMIALGCVQWWKCVVWE